MAKCLEIKSILEKVILTDLLNRELQDLEEEKEFYQGKAPEDITACNDSHTKAVKELLERVEALEI
ncbi:MAG: hypothetical protein ACI3XH_05465 [Phascolarctobacterium sp.]